VGVGFLGALLVALAAEAGARVIAVASKSSALELARTLGAAETAPARYEPFGLGPREAGLAGCALALGDLASLHEVWGDAATYASDDTALAAALTALLADPPLARERGAAGARAGAHLHPAADRRGLPAAVRLAAGGCAMRIVVLCHSLMSDWNHGNAHFLRGVVADLLDRGHDVRVFEPLDA
jgi:hypothetical protein